MVVIKRKITGTIKEISILPKPELKKESKQWKKDISALADKYYGTANKKEKTDMAVKAKVAVIKKAVVAKKEVVKAQKGKSIDDLWVEVLAGAVGKRLTDKALAVQMSEKATALTGKKRVYNEASVAGHRSGYNNGRFYIQKGVKPAVRLEKYVAPELGKGV